jgi:acyl-CoA thioester hydrolase
MHDKDIFHQDFIVPAEVVDLNHHVNNVAYVQWMQDAAVAHSHFAGGMAETQNIGATWVARSHQITYLRPAFDGDHIRLFTWITTLRKARSTRQYKFLRLSDNTVLATGTTEWVLVDAKTGRPRSIPASVADCFTVVSPDEEP